MPDVVTHRVETSWGAVRLQRTGRGLARLRLPERGLRSDGPDEPLPDDAAGWASLIRGYFDGERTDFSAIPLDMAGLSPAEIAIYDALRRVSYGHVTTYGELAVAAGLPGAAQAVGAAMGRNPWPLVVPCHRVLAKGRSLGGFSAPGGVDTKRRMLALEGAARPPQAPVLPGLFDGH